MWMGCLVVNLPAVMGERCTWLIRVVNASSGQGKVPACFRHAAACTPSPDHATALCAVQGAWLIGPLMAWPAQRRAAERAAKQGAQPGETVWHWGSGKALPACLGTPHAGTHAAML